MSATKGILRELTGCGGAVRRIDVAGDFVKSAAEWNGHIWTDGWGCGTEPFVVAEFAAALARRHAEVEPTFLIMEDIFCDFDTKVRIAAYERSQHLIGDAQLAVATASVSLAAELRRTWSLFALGDNRSRAPQDVPIEFEMTTVADRRRACDG